MKIFKQNIVNSFNVYHFVGHDKQLKHFLIDSFFHLYIQKCTRMQQLQKLQFVQN